MDIASPWLQFARGTGLAGSSQGRSGLVEMTSLNEARLSQADRGHAGLLSDTARSSGGGPLRLMAGVLLATAIVSGVTVSLSGRLVPWASAPAPHGSLPAETWG